MPSSLTLDTFSLPLDESGALPSNLISNEERTLPNNGIRNRAFTLYHGAFFVDSIVIVDSATGQQVPRNKYMFGLFSQLVSDKIHKEVATAIVITDPAISSKVLVTYQALGGPWGASNSMIIDMYNKITNDNRPVAWPDIIGKPDGYKPAHHLQDIGDMYGCEYFVEAIGRLTDAILMGDNASHNEIFELIDSINNKFSEAIDGLRAELIARMDAGDAALLARIVQAETNFQAALEALDNRLSARIQALDDRLSAHILQRNPHGTQPSDIGAPTVLEMNQAILALKNELINMFSTPPVAVAVGTVLTRELHNNRILRVTGTGIIYIPPDVFQPGDKFAIHTEVGAVQIAGSVGTMVLTVPTGKRAVIHGSGAAGGVMFLTNRLANVTGFLQNL